MRPPDAAGHEPDKVTQFGLKMLPGSQGAAPLIDGGLGWLECRVVNEPELRERHDLLIGDVVAASTPDAAETPLAVFGTGSAPAQVAPVATPVATWKPPDFLQTSWRALGDSNPRPLAPENSAAGWSRFVRLRKPAYLLAPRSAAVRPRPPRFVPLRPPFVAPVWQAGRPR